MDDTNKDTPSPMVPSRGARAVAWLALLLGAVMSVAANALHVTQVVGPEMGGASLPQVVSAAFWPVALILSIEVIARVVWPAGWGFTVLRWGGVGAVALVAAIVSYRHMHGLLLHWGEETITALLGPIGVDGLVTVGAVALMAISTHTTPAVKPQRSALPVRESTEQSSASTPVSPAVVAPQPMVETEPQTPVPDAPQSTGRVVNEEAVAKSGLPKSLQATVIAKLEASIASGKPLAPADLGPQIPPGMATKIIATGINGSH